MLKKIIQSDTLTEPEKIVKINEIATNAGNLEKSGPKVIQYITIAS